MKAINIRLDEPMIAAIKQAAAADNRTMSNWIKLAILEKLGDYARKRQGVVGVPGKADLPTTDEEDLL